MLTLRPYQNTALDHLRRETREGRNPLCVMPCGAGKGSLIANIVHGAVDLKKRVIFAVHGKSLVMDMHERVSRLGVQHGVIMGDHRRERWHPVQVASIDTLHRMKHPPAADLLIVDEAHMSLSPTWLATIARYPGSPVIGATATPVRLDGKGLGRASGGFFDSIVNGPNEEELIQMGYLVGSRVLAPPPPADIGNVKKTAGEFNQKQLATVCDKTTIIGDIVEHWRRHAPDKKTAAFAVDQAHASHITESFRSAGVQWAYVSADTPLSERAVIWRDLDNPTSGLMGVASVGCISIGWDHPVVSCLIAARPTASLGLWRQMLGRGSRVYPGKGSFLVLDHSGNTHRHAPYGMFEDSPSWSLAGATPRPVNDSEKPPSVTTCARSYIWPDKRNDPPRIVNGVQLPCYATFRTGPKECPYCGLPIQVQARAIEVVKGDLIELQRPRTLEERKSVAVTAEHKTKYFTLLGVARKRGYKDGWARWQFSKTYGFHPPMEWLPGAKELREALG